MSQISPYMLRALPTPTHKIFASGGGIAFPPCVSGGYCDFSPNSSTCKQVGNEKNDHQCFNLGHFSHVPFPLIFLSIRNQQIQFSPAMSRKNFLFRKPCWQNPASPQCWDCKPCFHLLRGLVGVPRGSLEARSSPHLHLSLCGPLHIPKKPALNRSW